MTEANAMIPSNGFFATLIIPFAGAFVVDKPFQYYVSSVVRIVLCIYLLIATSGGLFAQETAAPKTEKIEQKADTLQDFEKQLQKELDGNPEKSAGANEPSVLWQFVRTLLTLAVLLGIFYGIFRLYKFRRAMPRQTFSAMQTVYEYPLSAGGAQRLQIIELAGRLMILGVSENSVQLISEITDKYAIDRIKLDCAADSEVTQPDFLTELSRAIKVNLKDRFAKKTPGDFARGDETVTPDALEAQRQNSLARLRKLKSDKFDWSSTHPRPSGQGPDGKPLGDGRNKA